MSRWRIGKLKLVSSLPRGTGHLVHMDPRNGQDSEHSASGLTLPYRLHTVVAYLGTSTAQYAKRFAGRRLARVVEGWWVADGGSGAAGPLDARRLWQW